MRQIAFNFGKSLSFSLTFGFFLAVFLMLFFFNKALKEGLSALAAMFLAIIILTQGFPRITKTEFGEGLKKGSKLFAEKFNRVITWAGLTITYFIGVGLVWLGSRLVGKKFMQINQIKKQSHWIKKRKITITEEMF